ncbi:MAG: metal-dependent transcriptional regulator [Clostridiales bacterium]|nr:metal-dependent transcriptional regulator [Clostridiales bacterium]
MQLQESGEMYLETIYVLSKEKDNVRSLDIAEHMGFSKPSVSRAVKLLKTNDYITIDEYGFIHLTADGLGIAKKVFERHTILTDLFKKIGVPEEIAASDACKIEHCISDVTFEALKKHSHTK